MKKTALFILFIAFVSFDSKAQTDTKTIQEIETVCTYYLDGGTNGDSLMFSKAFVPDGQMRFMRNDTLFNLSLKDFMGRLKPGVKTNRKTKIENIQVFGDAASAKLTVEYPALYFHGFMGMLKTREGWKIVSVIFYREYKTSW